MRFQIFQKAIDGDWMAAFEALCRRWFADFEARAADPDEVANYPIVARFGTQSDIPLSPAMAQQTKPPAGAEEFYGVVVRLPLWRDIAGDSPLYLLRDHCSIRRQRPAATATALGWHQDSAVVTSQPRARDVRGYVLWVPFTPVDSATPTLQVMPYWLWPLKHHGNPQNGYLESVRKPWGRIVTIDHMAQGDVALFNINCPHRTLVTPAMTKDRFSVDLRVVRTVPKAYSGEAIRL